MNRSPIASCAVPESITLAVSAKANAMKKAGDRRRRLRRRRARLRHARVHQGRRQGGAGQGADEVHADALLSRSCAQAIAREVQPRERPAVQARADHHRRRRQALPLHGVHGACSTPATRCIIPSPYWVSYPEQVKLAGGVPKIVRGEESQRTSRSRRSSSKRRSRPKTKVLHHQLAQQPRRARVHAGGAEGAGGRRREASDIVIVFSDEIYEKLVYDGLKFVSFATLHPSLLERTLTFNCHSKSFAMTGWRVGYIGGPKHVIDAINKLQSQMTSHITSFTQMPAAAALTDPRGAESIEPMRQRIRETRPAHVGAADARCRRSPACSRRARSTASRTSARTSARRPAAQTITDAVSFAAALLEQSHVAVVPGNDSGFDTHVRLSFATSMEQIDKGIDRIAEFLKKLS